MKKTVLWSILFLSVLSIKTSKAQVHVDVHIGQPIDYYYLPEVQAYYYVPQKSYYYQHGGHWVSARYLPAPYRDYRISNARRIAIYEHRPYLHHDYYYSKYRSYQKVNYVNHDRYHHEKGKKNKYKGRGRH